MTTATNTRRLELHPKPTRTQTTITWARTLGHLAWIWKETLAVAYLVLILATATQRSPTVAVAAYAALTIASWDGHTRNTRDTLATIAKHRWRTDRHTNPNLPHLLSLEVGPLLPPRQLTRHWHRYGLRGIPAQHLTATIRPNPSDNNPDGDTDHLRRLFGFRTGDWRSHPDDPNLWIIELSTARLADHLEIT